MIDTDVKWIKITTNIFDDEKILLIESMPDAYAIITAWFKLLCLAGKQNNKGVFMLNDRIPYTEKMLATIFRMNEATVQLALKTFENFGMIETIGGVITIPNWGKHQSLDAYERRKEQDRERKKRNREQLISADKSAECLRNVRGQVRGMSADVRITEQEQDKEEEEYNNNNTTTFYEEHFEKLTAAKKEIVSGWLSDYGEKAVWDAMQIAAKAANVINPLAYIGGILENKSSKTADTQRSFRGEQEEDNVDIVL